MRAVYRVLAIIVAVEIVIQAMSMVFAIAGLYKWVDGGGNLDKATIESDDAAFSEIIGFIIHNINGMMIIPLVALLLLIVSFFAKVPNGVRAAGLVLILAIIQVLLGIFGHEVPFLGALHGLNAFLLLGASLYAARLAKPRDEVLEVVTP